MCTECTKKIGNPKIVGWASDLVREVATSGPVKPAAYALMFDTDNKELYPIKLADLPEGFFFYNADFMVSGPCDEIFEGAIDLCPVDLIGLAQHSKLFGVFIIAPSKWISLDEDKVRKSPRYQEWRDQIWKEWLEQGEEEWEGTPEEFDELLIHQMITTTKLMAFRGSALRIEGFDYYPWFPGAYMTGVTINTNNRMWGIGADCTGDVEETPHVFTRSREFNGLYEPLTNLLQRAEKVLA